MNERGGDMAEGAQCVGVGDKKAILRNWLWDGYVEVNLQTSRSETVDWWWDWDRWLLVD